MVHVYIGMRREVNRIFVCDGMSVTAGISSLTIVDYAIDGSVGRLQMFVPRRWSQLWLSEPAPRYTGIHMGGVLPLSCMATAGRLL